jgi:hypothetical protein
VTRRGPRAAPWLGLLALFALGCRVTLHFSGNDAGNDAAAPVSTLCESDQDCPLPSLHCDQSSGQCFACVRDSDCAGDGGLPRCDTIWHVCVQCGVQGDCGPGNWMCQADTCLKVCTTGTDCPSGMFCDDGMCEQCDGNRDCTSTSAPYCNQVTQQCVACVSDAQCADPTRHCDRATGRCVACLTGGDCQAGLICDPADWICKVPP